MRPQAPLTSAMSPSRNNLPRSLQPDYPVGQRVERHPEHGEDEYRGNRDTNDRARSRVARHQRSGRSRS